MNYDKEKTLALTTCLMTLGFTPKAADVCPLESDHENGECNYVLFSINGVRNTYYRASKTAKKYCRDKSLITFYKLTIERPIGKEIVIEREVR